MRSVGFTGTRAELPREQWNTLSATLADRNLGEQFHSGQCVGADEEAHHLAVAYGYRTHVWPPINRKFRAHYKGDVMHTAMTYGNRNLAIVQHADILIACPPGAEQDWPRSGTWMTVRIARKLGVPRIIIRQDGSVDRDGG